ncbi:glutathione S-transferase family protein [Pseudochelatococcus sp. B33]
MGIVLYELAAADPAIRFSPHCWKTRMALAHKGLEAERRPWRFIEKETIAFSGSTTVPVLVDHGEAVSDSWRIALHLEERYPDAPHLFPGAGAGVVALTRFVNDWADGALVPALIRLILRDIHDCLDEANRDYFRASREKRFGQSLEAVVADRPAHLAALREVLAPLRRTLREQDFLSGATPAYADYCVFGAFMWARCTSATELLAEDDPVFLWRERLLDAFGGLARSAPVAHAPSGEARPGP